MMNCVIFINGLACKRLETWKHRIKFTTNANSFLFLSTTFKTYLFLLYFHLKSIPNSSVVSPNESKTSSGSTNFKNSGIFLGTVNFSIQRLE